MNAAQLGIVAVCSSGVGTTGGTKVSLESRWRLAEVSVCAAEDIVGTHTLVGCAVMVEVFGEALSQRVVGHHGVGKVLPLQLLQMGEHLLMLIACTCAQYQQAP